MTRNVRKLSMAVEGAERVVAVLLSAPVTRIGSTAFERCFIAFCMFWSLNLTGVFQVGRKGFVLRLV